MLHHQAIQQDLNQLLFDQYKKNTSSFQKKAFETGAELVMSMFEKYGGKIAAQYHKGSYHPVVLSSSPYIIIITNEKYPNGQLKCSIQEYQNNKYGNLKWGGVKITGETLTFQWKKFGVVETNEIFIDYVNEDKICFYGFIHNDVRSSMVDIVALNETMNFKF